MRLAVGIDLGGTKTAAGLVDETGKVLARFEAPTPASDGPGAVLDTAIRLARRLLDEPDVVAVGIGAAGVIDPVARTVVSATDTLPGWAGTPLGAALEDALARPVATLNDVHAHAVGEAWAGAARGARSVLLIAAGTGIGGAQVIDGTLQGGAHFVAGHFGHTPSAEAKGLPCTCGRTGHLEMIAAGPAIHSAFVRAGGTAADTRDVFARAAAGDALAVLVTGTAATALGRAIGGFVNALDPDVVVISGGLSASGELWWAPLREGVAREIMPVVAGCPVLPAALGADAAIIGAARVAFDLEVP